ncbi:hypothetical protein ONZ43_g2754 [Nemania bipapillata]|uniref:Uncharacterized protein n=1 Tax=Nemania bipapillata TaxID=110536 RepID=A0ACC2IZE1_9PEZI|nr:hypothetical protein ONZ43_g2754 [Nemania bipapillata]
MDANEQGEGLGPNIELDYELVLRNDVPTQIVDSAAASVQTQISEVRKWLKPTDYLSPGNEFMKHLHSHVPGTGSWLSESPAFQSWTTPDKPNCLAVRGVAGSGKSVLAASTIHQLQEAEPHVPVLFFFFRQIVEKNHSARYMIRDFASQLLPYSPSLILRLCELRKSNRVEGNEHGLLLDALTRSLHGIEKAYIVVDALDEMDDQDFIMIDRLAQLGNREGSKVKVLFTSRPIPRIEETMRALQVPHVRVDSTMTYPDVAKYVTVSISSLDTTLSPEKEDRVKQAICERARGLFLHARLMTDTLTEGLQTGRITEATLPESLDRLPYNLIDVYEEMLKEHSKRSGVDAEQQARILTCVVHASRPLRLIELGSLVARIIGSGDLKEGKALVRASCGRLLEILDDETVSIIHHSFTEFLHDETRASRAGSFPVLDEVAAHAMLTRLSLQYLDYCPLLGRGRDSPDRTYHGRSWVYDESERRKQVLQDLLHGRSPLSYAAEKGHFQIAEYLLKHGAIPDEDNEGALTPMHYAACHGHADIVKLLIDSGISPLIQKMKENASHRHKAKTALQFAFERGHGAVLDIMLPLVPASQANQCLHWAKKADHMEMVLKTGNANVDSYYRGQTMLFRAAERCDLEAIQVLLRYGADPNKRCGESLTIDEYGNVTSESDDFPQGPTPIHAFAGYFDMPSLVGDGDIEKAQQCLEALISQGAQIDARANDANGMQWRRNKGKEEGHLTALHYAVRKQEDHGLGPWFYQDTQEILVKLLLEAGADPNARSRLGRNCIHFADPQLPHLIDLLVAGGADVNATDVNDQTPLLALLSPNGLHDVTNPNVEVFQKLIQNGADISLCSTDGNTALHMVFMSLSKFKSRDIPFLLSLVSSRDDFNKKNNAGLVPLLVYNIPKYEVPRSKDGEEILNAMIQKARRAWTSSSSFFV